MNPSSVRPGRALAAVLAVAFLTAALPGPVAREARAQGGLSALRIDVDAVTRTARGAVVTVSAERMLVPRGSSKTPVRPRPHTRVGTGVAVAEDEVLTTASVVSGATRIVLTASNGLQSEAEIAGLDEVFNIALLKVRSMRLPPLRYAENRPAEIGDWVIALGRSYGMKTTQSVGYVSMRYREPHSSLLQTTNTVYPGNSGGAALDAEGRLVGLILGELANRDAYRLEFDEHNPASVTFVVPAEVVRAVHLELREKGRVPHGYLGVSTMAANVPSDTRPGTTVPIGARVVRVTAGGPGERAGLKAGDLIVGYGEERVEFPAQLARWVSTSRPGTTMRLVWVRDELQHTGRVTLTESPYAAPQWSSRADDPAEKKRIAELERRIEELNRELGAIKGRRPSPAMRSR